MRIQRILDVVCPLADRSQEQDFAAGEVAVKRLPAVLPTGGGTLFAQYLSLLGDPPVCRVGKATPPTPTQISEKGRYVVTRSIEPDGQPLAQPLAKERVRVLDSF